MKISHYGLCAEIEADKTGHHFIDEINLLMARERGRATTLRESADMAEMRNIIYTMQRYYLLIMHRKAIPRKCGATKVRHAAYHRSSMHMKRRRWSCRTRCYKYLLMAHRHGVPNVAVGIHQLL